MFELGASELDMPLSSKRYDVIVVGAGHAGVEAALASARLGCRTLLITINLDTIAKMSCNPAIGGLGKGQLVREIDALGGEMAKATDMCGLQFRMLSTSKGPAVRAPRSQCDKKEYQTFMKLTCERQPGLKLLQAQVTGIISHNGEVQGVTTSLGSECLAGAVVVTTGTFLCGTIYIGFDRHAGGRAGEPPAVALSESLSGLGLRLGRFKTGTPPRLLKSSIDLKATETQHGDEPPPRFSHWLEDLFHVEHSPRDGGCRRPTEYLPNSVLARIGHQLPCHITYTTSKTAELINQNLTKSPLYAGVIKGVGPRYCPSIEDKIVRFPQKPRHQIFLEPEGVATDEIYLNGFSTSLPFDVQIDLVRTIIGCENAHILRPAYAIEYDFVYPNQLLPTLETRQCKNLFLAGQINGTSGYEEAAAQGLIAGVNAARSVKSLPKIRIRRDQGYIGVLIDDLVTKGISEPYRMFTSNAEYRLLLRQDNADLRLAQLGYELGLVSERNYKRVLAKKDAVANELHRLQTSTCGGQTLARILSRPEIRYRDLPSHDDTLPVEIVEQVELETKYAGYIGRQLAEVERMRNLEDKKIPESFDYSHVPSLRVEARQKLTQVRPTTVGQAARIPGVSPADMSVLIVWLKRATDAGLAVDTTTSPSPDTADLDT